MKLKLFDSMMVIVPHAWMPLMGAREAHHQAYLVAVAGDKKALAVMLDAAGTHPSIVSDMHMAKAPHSDPVKELVAARIVTFDEPGLWAYKSYQVGGVIAAISGRNVNPVARWVRGDAISLHAERLTGSQPDTQRVRGE